MTGFQKFVKYCAIALAAVIIVGIFGSIYGIGSLIFGIADFTSKESTETVETVISPKGDIENLDIDVAAASLKIVTGDTLKAETDSEYITLTQKGNTLKIEEKKIKLFTNRKSGLVIITLPEGFAFKTVEIDAGAGEIDAAALNTQRLDMDLGAGAVRINDLTVSLKSDIDGGAGIIEIEQASVNDLDLDMGVGELKLEAALSGDSQIDCGVGEADITLIGSKDDYTVMLEKGLGNADIDGHDIKNGTAVGSGVNRLSISGGVGNIKLTFSK